MWYQVGSACYATALQAAQAQASQQVGAVVVHGSAAHVVGVSSVTDTSITYTFAPVDGGATVSYAAAFSAQPCNLLTAEDGLSIGWMIVGAWVATYAIMFLARAIFGGHDKDGADYGHS